MDELNTHSLTYPLTQSAFSHSPTDSLTIFQMAYGIGKKFVVLPGEWWIHALIIILMMITLAYLEVGRQGRQAIIPV